MRVEFFQLPKGDVLAGFEEIFRIAKERNLDFVVLSLGVTDKDRIEALLTTDEVRKAAISVGVGRITGKGFTFSPKLPYISENGIIINVKRCEELGIPDNMVKANSHSHFEDAGGVHATLISFLESVVPYGELYMYPYADEVKAPSSKIAQLAKNLFSKVNYEIQKKYDDKT